MYKQTYFELFFKGTKVDCALLWNADILYLDVVMYIIIEKFSVVFLLLRNTRVRQMM